MFATIVYVPFKGLEVIMYVKSSKSGSVPSKIISAETCSSTFFDIEKAVGLSFTGDILMDTVASLLLEIPSFTLNLKVSTKSLSDILL